MAIGIDIGDDCIRCVEMRRTFNRFFVSNYLEVENADYESALKNIRSRLNPKVKSVAISLPYGMTMIKRITVDNSLSDAECEIFLKNNIERYFGLPVKEICFDYIIYNRQEKTRDMQVIGVRQDQVEKYLESFKKIGMVPCIVDVEPFALWRMILRQYKLRENTTAIVINFRQKSFLFCVINKEQILYLCEEEITDTNYVAVAAHCFSVLHSIGAEYGKTISLLFLAGEYVADEEFITLISKNIDLPLMVANAFIDINCAHNITLTRQNSSSAMVACNLALTGCAYG